METDQLDAFDRVAREGTFSRAAVVLGIGQPAVSSRIQSLEEVVGGALFTRGRTTTLTALGESFLPYARRVLEVLREGVESARMAQVGKRGKIKFGSLGSLAGGLVGPALARFVRARPGVEYAMRAGAHETIVEMLMDGILDVALITWPCAGRVAAELSAIFAFEEPVVLVAHPEHALAARCSVSRDDVTKLARPLLYLRWWQKHHAAITRLAERSGTVMELPMETARHLVHEGIGAGFFARTYVSEDLAAGRLVEVAVRGLAPLSRAIALVRRRNAPLSPAGAELIRFIRVEVSRLGLREAKRAVAKTGRNAKN